jgi:serine/threonine protein phosphatase PrpC
LFSLILGQLAVSRALGDANFAPFISSEPYLRSAAITEDHTHLVLACDGLWDVFPDSLAAQIVCNQPEPVQAAAMLRDRAFASGSTDNISVLCLQFLPPLPQASKGPSPEKKTLKVPTITVGDGDDPFGGWEK